jgi:hypothetical protein
MILLPRIISVLEAMLVPMKKTEDVSDRLTGLEESQMNTRFP